ncbi:zinc finger protein SHOOT GRAVITROPISM 5-like [Andrographis paniculata]|uniref:zinc finger protein SHOOT GRAVITROPISM 5-like n=1 Tax=Andrographis paniculata TaxID=175694 RepID=UPI0021E8DBF3|nr:zinc finger protein SHOOT GRAVITROPISM 5-like [Andrographis paniculata]
MMLSNIDPSPPPPLSDDHRFGGKRKRRPAGTPDPDAEVVSLSPKTLMESDRYVCEICNQGFQRDQNLQMHRRRHKVPWKLLKRESPVAKKRVFVCPEPTCLHHDPRHALGDLVGIKKHFRRKHSNQKQWICQKCSKGYAVQSDYKAHLKTCGTRGHSCDCGRVFSRVESFIEHQDACTMGRLRSDPHRAAHPPPPPPPLPRPCLSRTASSPSPSTDTNLSVAPWAAAVLTLANPAEPPGFFNKKTDGAAVSAASRSPNLELQLLTKSSISGTDTWRKMDDQDHSTHLHLSMGSSPETTIGEKPDAAVNGCSPRGSTSTTTTTTPNSAAAKLKEQADEHLRMAMAEKAYAEEARRQARRQIEVAEQEFTNARRIRQQAQAELGKAQALKEQSTKQINSTMLLITCHSCKHKYQVSHPPPATWPAVVPEPSSSSSPRRRDSSLGLSYISSALREWEFSNKQI